MAYHDSWSAHNRNTWHSALVRWRFSIQWWWLWFLETSDHSSVGLAFLVINVVIPNIVNLWCTNTLCDKLKIILHLKTHNTIMDFTRNCIGPLCLILNDIVLLINSTPPNGTTEQDAKSRKFKYVTANSDSLIVLFSPLY